MFGKPAFSYAPHYLDSNALLKCWRAIETQQSIVAVRCILIQTASLPCSDEQTPSTFTHCSLTFGWSRTGTTTLTVTLMGLSLVMSTMRRCSTPSPPLLAFDEPFKLFSLTLLPSAGRNQSLMTLLCPAMMNSHVTIQAQI
jgi:hypothetical protein